MTFSESFLTVLVYGAMGLTALSVVLFIVFFIRDLKEENLW